MKHGYSLVLFFLFLTACAVLFLNTPGTNDIGGFVTWTKILDQHGLIEGYRQSKSEYPPLGVIMLSLAVRGGAVLQLDPALSIKSAILLMLLLTTAVFYLYTRSLLLTTLLLGIFLLNSTALGYVDVFFAPVLLLAVFALARQRPGWGVALFTLACFIKWQVVILAPFVAIYALNVSSLSELRAIRPRRLLAVGGTVAIILLGVLIVFQEAVLLSFWYALTASTYLSGTALNFNWVLTYLLHLLDPGQYGPLVEGRSEIIVTENPTLTVPLKLIFFTLYGLALWGYFKAAKTLPNFLLYTTLGYLAYFTFNTGVHENHLAPVCLLLAVLAYQDRAAVPLLLIWAAVFNINMLVFYGLDGRGLPFSRVVGGVDVTLLLAALVTLLFLGLALPVLQRARLATKP